MPRSVSGSPSQSAVEEDEVLSTNATVGSEYGGHFEPSSTSISLGESANSSERRSRSGTPHADHELQDRARSSQARRPLTRALVRQAQLHHSAQDDQQPVSARNDTPKRDDGQFRGLTPPPLPYETRPQKKKRAIQEIIEDNSPREPDRMTREIDDLLKPKQQEQAESSSAVAAVQRRGGNSQSAETSLDLDHTAKRIKKTSSSKGDDGLS
ncbi:hypothetical protein PG997_008508 [Apiospora hydei]|uniref:Uncharacterized protein n=1 Tax=Apiospora hydei TaxID=1337664 RepID=A0ABR1WE06_9PEZI